MPNLRLIYLLPTFTTDVDIHLKPNIRKRKGDGTGIDPSTL